MRRAGASRPDPATQRIALISSSYAPYVGGVEEHVRRVARGLADDGHAVEVWTVDRGRGEAREILEGIPVRRLPTPMPARALGPLWRFAIRFPAAWRRWSAAHRRFRPSVLHVQCFGPNGMYALALHRRFGTPLMVTSHGETMADDGDAFGRSAFLARGLTSSIAGACAVTAPSSAVLSDLERRYGLGEGEVVPNGVDDSVVASPFEPPSPFLFAVGRLGRMKGFDLLLRAFAAAELEESMRLVIAGDGPQRAELDALTRELGIADRVELRGWLDEQEIADAMSSAIAVVVPSRMEAFGIVALEAWRSAAALVMTSRGGATEFMTDGVDALLVDPLQQADLAAALARVASDADLRARLAAAGRIRVEEFRWERVVAAYADAYARCARPRG